MPSTTRHIAYILLPLLVLVGVVMLQARYDAIVLERFVLRAPVHKSVMPAPIVRQLAFGFDNMLADYYWVTAVQDYLKWDSRDAYYPEYLRLIAALDHRFEYPYLFAILTLPTKGNPASLGWLSDIAAEGVRAFPLNYQIPFSAATQFHIMGGDNARALHFLAIAASVPEAPELVHRTYGIYLMRDATDYKKSRALFETILATTDNDESKRIVQERITLLDFIEVLEQAILEYKAKQGAYPPSIPALLKKTESDVPESVTALINKYSPQIDQETGKILLR